MIMSKVICHMSDCVNWNENVCAAQNIEVNVSEENKEATCSTYEEKAAS
jgi:Domain of Unknown Function (DUF1540)